jgi:hypothetical protein
MQFVQNFPNNILITVGDRGLEDFEEGFDPASQQFCASKSKNKSLILVKTRKLTYYPLVTNVL